MEPKTNPTAQPTPTPAPVVKEPKKGVLDLEAFPNEADAIAAVKDRVKGHRRVFKATANGKEEVFVASHPAYVAQFLYQRGGGTITEAGKAPRASGGGGGGTNPASVNTTEAALAFLMASGLPEAEKARIKEQLEKLGKTPAGAKK